MKVLSSQEMNQIAGGFSATSLVSSLTCGAFVGVLFGGLTLPAACAGAALFGTFNILYQAAISIDQTYPSYDQGCYDYYYVY